MELKLTTQVKIIYSHIENAEEGVFQVVSVVCFIQYLPYAWAWNIIAEYDNISPVRPDIDKFCPTIEGCDNGLHVLCLHNQNIYGKHGPSCNYSAEVALLEVHKYKIVNYINSIRRRAALGKEKNILRGYGINMVSWDKYLADFAQIWADQCVFRTDHACHATPDFPNPAQIITGIRYSFPDIKKYERRNMNSKNSNSKTKTKTDNDDPQTRAKKFVERTILMVIEGWYKSKNNSAIKGMYYDQLVYHRVTHIGCGISVFISYEHQRKKKIPPVLNYMMLVCNLSHKLPSGKEPYETVRNASEGFTERCGCPPGTDEDEDTCLCYKSTSKDKVKNCPFGFCQPKVVLLPIVTVENAPPTKSELRSRKLSADDYNYYKIINGLSDVSLLNKEAIVYNQERSKFQDLTQNIFDEPKVIVIDHDKIGQIFHNQSFDDTKLVSLTRPNNIPKDNHLIGNDESNKENERTKIDKLFQSNLIDNKLLQITPIVKDVAHRKNFDVAHNVLDAYMESRKNNRSHKFENDVRIKEFYEVVGHQNQALQLQNDAETDKRLVNRKKGTLNVLTLYDKESENINENPQSIKDTDPQVMQQIVMDLVKKGKTLKDTDKNFIPMEKQTRKSHDTDIQLSKKVESLPNPKVGYFSKYPVIGSDYRNKMRDDSMHVKLNIHFGEDMESNLKQKLHNDYKSTTELSVTTHASKTSKEHHNHNVLKLLENLEAEVHHLQLSKDEKDLLHNKLKKIYNDIEPRVEGGNKLPDVNADKVKPDTRTDKTDYDPLHLFNTRPIIHQKTNKPNVSFTDKSHRDDDKDVLSISRRRYYQEKLEKLAQKLLKRRRQHNALHENTRYVRPTLQDNYAQSYPAYPAYPAYSLPLRPFGDTLYVPGRARPMHGYNWM